MHVRVLTRVRGTFGLYLTSVSDCSLVLCLERPGHERTQEKQMPSLFSNCQLGGLTLPSRTVMVR
jgi:hypothetical protein